jgi:hypothetical protein
VKKIYVLIVSMVALISLALVISTSTNGFPINTNTFSIHYDDNNDGSWIYFTQEECSYWCKNYGLPVVTLCAGGGTSCDKYIDQFNCPVLTEGQSCVTKPWNYAIALAKRNREGIAELMIGTTPATTTTTPSGGGEAITTTTIPECKQKYEKCSSDEECCSNSCHKFYKWCS